MPDPVVYSPVIGLDGPVYYGTAGTDPAETDANRLLYITGPALTITSDMEEADIVAVGLVKAYYEGKMDIGITFDTKKFQTDSGVFPPDIAALKAAKTTRSALAITVKDSAIGDIKGDFLVSKMDENRENGKIISWSVELKPTFIGRAVVYGSGSTL